MKRCSSAGPDIWTSRAACRAHADEAQKLAQIYSSMIRSRIGTSSTMKWLSKPIEPSFAQKTRHCRRRLGRIGCWANSGIRLEVRRKPVFWYPADDDSLRAENGCPVYLFELPDGVFYGIPQIDEWGFKVAEHTGGKWLTIRSGRSGT